MTTRSGAWRMFSPLETWPEWGLSGNLFDCGFGGGLHRWWLRGIQVLRWCLGDNDGSGAGRDLVDRNKLFASFQLWEITRLEGGEQTPCGLRTCIMFRFFAKVYITRNRVTWWNEGVWKTGVGWLLCRVVVHCIAWLLLASLIQQGLSKLLNLKQRLVTGSDMSASSAGHPWQCISSSLLLIDHYDEFARSFDAD